MNNNTTPGTSTRLRIKRIIAHLESIQIEDTYNFKDTARAWLESQGLKFFASGAYSYCYRIGRFVIKISSTAFNEKVKPLLDNPVYRTLTPKVYWIHSKGYALVCRFVKAIQLGWSCEHDTFFYAMKSEIVKRCEEAGITVWDLHRENLLILDGSLLPIVVDYDCLYLDI
jgi:hypothetical protein